jgi:hypothetical protein
MSYAADHMAWQQRINQEFSAASRFMDRTYANQMSMGHPMGTGQSFPTTTMYAPKVTSGYIAKSRLKGSSAASVRSKSMRSGMSRRSQLSRKKPTKRFNEELDVVSRTSKQPKPHNYSVHKQSVTKQVPSRPVVDEKKQLIDKINKLDENNLEKLVQKPIEPPHEPSQPDVNSVHEEDKESVAQNNENEQYDQDEEAKRREEQELHEEIDSLYYGSQYSQSESRRSQMTSATYISKLEKELQEERRAREKLAQELEEIKKLSSEISSHLGLNKANEAK